MNTVRDYQAKGVVFVEGDVVTYSSMTPAPVHWEDCNGLSHGQSIPVSFEWRNITGTGDQLDQLDQDMMVEVDYYHDSLNFGTKKIPVSHVSWDQPTVHKSWRPVIIPTIAEQPKGVFHGKKFVLTGTFSEGRHLVKKYVIEHGGEITGSVDSSVNYLVVGDMCVHIVKFDKAKVLGVEVITFDELKKLTPPERLLRVQPLVHTGAELYYIGELVEVVTESNGVVCVKHGEGQLQLIRDISELKSPEQVELEAGIRTFLKGIDGGVHITGAKAVEFLASELIKAGYRKEQS